MVKEFTKILSVRRRLASVLACLVLVVASANGQSLEIAADSLVVRDALGSAKAELRESGIKTFDAGAATAFLETNGTLTLGGSGLQGRLRVRDSDGLTTTIHLDGSIGSVELGSVDQSGFIQIWDQADDNAFSIVLSGGSGNVVNKLAGNGLVKGWAKMDADGTLDSCYNCNSSTAETRRISKGRYEVDFTPLGENIRSRVALCTVGHLSDLLGAGSFIKCGAQLGDDSSILLAAGTLGGENQDVDFTVVVF